MTGHQAEASHALRSYHVDVTASHNLPMYEVANTVTVPTDEMLAVMEYRMRHAAQKLRKA
jgi:hypothetical protein